MEDGPDSINTNDIAFIAKHKKIFSPEEVIQPEDKCHLLAVAVKYGLVFCCNGNTIKVYQSRSLLSDEDASEMKSLNVGHPIIHISTSCDGLTLAAIIVFSGKLLIVLYDVPSIVIRNDDVSPFAAAPINGIAIQSVCWNPMDPATVAIAASPEALMVFTIQNNNIDSKVVQVKARALSWSPKGKQLTVGLEDGSLAMVRPDLTLVRNVKAPPLEGVGAVQNITWFTNTEFFIGYKQIIEDEINQVVIYVNAPRAQEPKFILYEFICNENVGPRPPMFYQHFQPEWNLLCLASSRDATLGIIGTAEGGGWCEYELEEDKKATMHCINITETTYALGMAVDFTSQKLFSNKDNVTSGPYPVIYVLSTGGEINIFHMMNLREGVPSLVNPPAPIPQGSLRTGQQYQACAALLSSIVNACDAVKSSNVISVPKPSIGNSITVPKMPAFGGSGSTLSFGGSVQPSLPKFTSQAPQFIEASGSGTFQFSAPLASSSASLPTFNTATSTSSFSAVFSSATTSTPSFSSVFSSAATSTPSFSSVFSSGTTSTPPLSSVFSSASAASGISAPQVPQPKEELKPQPLQISSSASVPIAAKPKPEAVAPISISKAVETLSNIKPVAQSVTSVRNNDADKSQILNAISTTIIKFEDELQKQSKMIKENNIVIGTREDRGTIRQSLISEGNWIQQMSSTTNELMAEVTQLNSEILQGFKLHEKANAQINKSKNPRHFMSVQSRQLDPHSRKTLELVRSKYQYLQSQLEEVNMRLHLDYVNYTNALKNKKTRDKPISETVYKALMNCHTLRTGLERDLEVLCDRLKAFKIDRLGQSLGINTQHNKDDLLASLEESLKEMKMSPSVAAVSPLKQMSPVKQQKLIQMLAKRNTIPVRKCSSSPRVKLTDSPESAQSTQNENQEAAASVSLSGDTSFGPHTFSTPNRNCQVTSGLSGATSINSKLDFNISLTSTPSTLPNKLELNTASSKPNLEPIKPIYEDITPPQTPDNKPETKTASPLLALTSLVSKVPTTKIETAPESVIIVSEDKPDTQVTSAGFGTADSTSSSISFSFKAPSSSLTASSTSQSNVTSSVSNSLPQFTSFNFATNPSNSSITLQTQATDVKTSLYSPVATSAPLPAFNLSGNANNFSFKSPASTAASSSGLFSLKFPSSSATSVSSISADSSKSSFTVVSTSSLPSTLSGILSGSGTSSITITPKPVDNTNKVISTSLESTLSASVSTASSSLKLSDSNNSAFGIVKVSVPDVQTKDDKSPSISTEATSITKNISVSSSLLSSALSSPIVSQSSSTLSTASPFGTNTSSSLFSGGSSGNLTLFKSPTFSLSPLAGSTLKTTDTSPSGGSASLGTATSSSSSIFSNSTLSNSSGVFGVASTSSTSAVSITLPTITSTQASSASITSLTSSGSSTTASPNVNLFASVSSATSGGSVFGSIMPSTTSSLFSSTTTSSTPVFTSSTTSSSGSMFNSGSNISSSSIFGSKGTTSSGSIFSSVSSTSTGGSLFSSVNTVSSSGSGFGSVNVTSSTTPSTASVFGSSSTTSSAGSVFASSNTTTTTTSTGSLFGSTSTTSSSSIFGSSNTAVSSAPSFAQPSAFGALPASSNSTTMGGGSIFGQKTNSAFGQTTQSSSTSAFGQTTQSSSTSAFGQTTQSSSTSIFGGQTTTSSGSVFGGSQGGSVFGSPSAQSPNMFGGTPASQSGSIFGGTANQTSGTPASQPGSIFGSPVTTTQSSGSVFGQPSATSPFSSIGASQETSTPFGSGGFGMGTNNSGVGFFSGLGSKPSEDSANKNVFGSASFEAPKPQLSLFGGQPSTSSTFGGGSVFGGAVSSASTSQTTSTFGSPGFGNNDSAQKSGFGSNAFGGAPVFGGAPAFGSPPKFGSTPAFGSSSPFGSIGGGSAASPGSVFGSSFGSSAGGAAATGSTFGSVVANTPSSSSGFGSFGANQNSSVSFGAIAQQSPPSQGGFGSTGNTFSGGSNFSSWR